MKTKSSLLLSIKKQYREGNSEDSFSHQFLVMTMHQGLESRRKGDALPFSASTLRRKEAGRGESLSPYWNASNILQWGIDKHNARSRTLLKWQKFKSHKWNIAFKKLNKTFKMFWSHDFNNCLIACIHRHILNHWAFLRFPVSICCLWKARKLPLLHPFRKRHKESTGK